MIRVLASVALACVLAGCAGMPHSDPQPGEGYGGYAEWRWPYIKPGHDWADHAPYPDKVPDEFRTAQVRLVHMREGCANLLFPAYVTVAERQYNKALRAFAAEYYDDSFVDLRALNNQLDEIDRRIHIAGADSGCHGRRNRDNNGHGYEHQHDVPHCGHNGAEFNCALDPNHSDKLRKPGCGKVSQCPAKTKQQPTPCNSPQCPWRDSSHAHSGAGHDQNNNHASGHAGGPGPRLGPNGAPYQSLDTLFLKAQFPYNSDQVLPEYTGYLQQLATQLQQRGYPHLYIQGHASSEGNENYNRELSQRRAAAVRRLLANYGVPLENMQTAGFGESQPDEPNSTELGRAANRRVEIYVESRPNSASSAAP